jgi:hypothetical protein
MSHSSTVAAVRQSVLDAFAQVDACFDLAGDERTFRSESGAWTIDEILEHIALTNHYLLLTWRKAVATAVRRAAEGEQVPAGESDLERLRAIGERGTFRWVHPDHMTPRAQASSAELRERIRGQAHECLTLLDLIDDGKGALLRLHMSVGHLGRIDLYQWLYFLAQHVRRHLQRVTLIREEAEGSSEQ